MHEGLNSLRELLAAMLKFDVYKENFDPERAQLGSFSRIAQRCVDVLAAVARVGDDSPNSGAIKGLSSPCN